MAESALCTKCYSTQYYEDIAQINSFLGWHYCIYNTLFRQQNHPDNCSSDISKNIALEYTWLSMMGLLT